MNPSLSGGDVDAAWEDSNVAGEESVGGSVSTPDQDIVDEIGEAAGLNYRDDEPLDSDKKILDRDRNRWELNPESADDGEEDEGSRLEAHQGKRLYGAAPAQDLASHGRFGGGHACLPGRSRRRRCCFAG